MLTAAKRRLASLENVEVRSGSVESLPVENGELHVAMLFMVTHFVLEPGKVLAEVRRALAPGGRLVILDLTSHGREDYSLQMGHVWQGFTEEQVRPWVTEAGLAVARYRDLPADPKATATGHATWTAPARGTWRFRLPASPSPSCRSAA